MESVEKPEYYVTKKKKLKWVIFETFSRNFYKAFMQ